MASKTLQVIQQILEHLDNSMDGDVVDMTAISPEALEITEARWHRVIGMMVEEGLIDGFAKVTTLQTQYNQYKAITPEITLRGLHFMNENKDAAKLYRIAKEIRDWIK
ncbi:YjcQ family protein [Paenibacillus phocaensis]|jgi:hypothetical protein|uniref:YjcQ family protein n=1 Tax=Paenibacillus phocaensis TaxID=1776378 RepID=UPI000839CE5D|nr:YjcQ family protein [Paenibacillus phocaensis]